MKERREKGRERREGEGGEVGYCVFGFETCNHFIFLDQLLIMSVCCVGSYCDQWD